MSVVEHNHFWIKYPTYDICDECGAIRRKKEDEQKGLFDVVGLKGINND